MAKDINFYNKESGIYSAKRYPATARTYVQFFFKKRLKILLDLLGKTCAGRSGLSLLEIGCADGVVIREIDACMGGAFGEMTGIDTAPDMVRAAQSMTVSARITYVTRGDEPAGAQYDAVIEVGVANYADFDEELAYAARAMKPDARYFLSIAGRGSLNDRFGRGTGYANFLSYHEYESKIRAMFDVEETRVVGIFMPFLWLMPALGRIVQPAVEAVLAPIAPGLFHEKVYVLKKKGE